MTLRARLAVSACVLSLGAALASEGCAARLAPKPSAEAPIVVGVSLGLTRDLASLSGPLRDAIRVAESELNAGGGVLGRQLRFEVSDDRSDEGSFVEGIAQRFAGQGVSAILGPVGSGQVLLTQKIAAEQQILQLTPTATSVELTAAQAEGERFLFRTTPSDDLQAAALMLLARKTPRGLGDGGTDAGTVTTCKRMALVSIDNAYGASMAKVLTEKFPKLGAPGERSIVAERTIPVEAQASYEDIVPGLLSKKPECLALIAYEKAAAQLVRDIRRDSRYPALERSGFFFLGSDGVFTQGFLDLSLTDPSDPASESTALGVFGTNPDTQPGTAEYNAFRALYGAYFPLAPGVDAPAFAANAFDAAVLIAFAIQKAGSATDRVAIRDALKDVSRPEGRPIAPSELAEGLAELRRGGDIDYKGASGNVDFDESGNVRAGFIVWRAVRRDPRGPVAYETVARFTAEELLREVE